MIVTAWEGNVCFHSSDFLEFHSNPSSYRLERNSRELLIAITGCSSKDAGNMEKLLFDLSVACWKMRRMRKRISKTAYHSRHLGGSFFSLLSGWRCSIFFMSWWLRTTMAIVQPQGWRHSPVWTWPRPSDVGQEELVRLRCSSIKDSALIENCKIMQWESQENVSLFSIAVRFMLLWRYWEGKEI